MNDLAAFFILEVGEKIRNNLAEFFIPGVGPSKCCQSYRAQYDGATQDIRRVLLQDSGSVFVGIALSIRLCEEGIAGRLAVRRTELQE